MDEQKFTLKLFGGEANIILYTPLEEEAKEIIREAYSEALKLQKIFNFFDKESELSVLNSKRKLQVSEELLHVIKKALEFSDLTKGKYDITLGKSIRQRKNKQEVSKIKGSYKDIKINGNEITLENADVMIDLGSIAKGYITDKIAEFLKEKGLEEFIIDSRGDIVVSGNEPYALGIKHPRQEGNIFSIKLKNQAVATSGDYNQFDKTFDKSHIINQNNVISVTIVANTLEEADAYATAFFVAKEKEREKMIKSNKFIKGMILDKKLNTSMFNGFESLVYD